MDQSPVDNSNCEDDPSSPNNIIEVAISHGKRYPPLKVSINICSPGNEPPAQSYIMILEGKAIYSERYPVPFELASSAFLDLGDKVIVNMDETAGIDRDPKDLVDDYMSIISFEVLQATYRYMIATDVSRSKDLEEH
jgi:hypothetical protein